MILDPLTIVLVMLALVVAGSVKGALGIGLPAVAMSILPVLIEPALGVALLALPIVVTNIQQIVTVPRWRAIVADYRVAGAFTFGTTFVVSQTLPHIPTDIVTALVGAMLILFSGAALFKIDFPVTKAARWQVACGIASGLAGGLSAVKAPVMIYCAALKTPREEFLVSAGFLFFVGGLGLISGLSLASVFTFDLVPLSIGAVIATVIGFQIGAFIGKRINAALFRRLLLSLMLMLGLRMVVMLFV